MQGARPVWLVEAALAKTGPEWQCPDRGFLGPSGSIKWRKHATRAPDMDPPSPNRFFARFNRSMDSSGKNYEKYPKSTLSVHA